MRNWTTPSFLYSRAIWLLKWPKAFWKIFFETRSFCFEKGLMLSKLWKTRRWRSKHTKVMSTRWTAKMHQMSIEEFKCLIYTWRLQTMENTKALLKCIARLETVILTKVQNLIKMCQLILQTKDHAGIVTKASSLNNNNLLKNNTNTKGWRCFKQIQK